MSAGRRSLPSLDRSARVWVAGHRGLVGSAITRLLQAQGFSNLILRTSQELDLRSQGAVEAFYRAHRPDYIFLAAAKVGGILANRDHPAEFLYDNLAIQNNVIDGALRNGAQKVLFLGSSCIYPKMAPQPIPESSLLSGPLEPTNQPYALAKIAGLEMIRAYHRQHGLRGVSLMPTNLYGPGDNFDPATSHALPAMIRRIDEAREAGAKQVVMWGTGSPRREFMHADDLARAALLAMEEHEDPEPVNVGMGEDMTIRELAELTAKVVGWQGEFVWDTSKPDGTPRKLLETSRIRALGWKPEIRIEDGIRETWEWWRHSQSSAH
jgi:GDP-L-fucose synthase